MDTLLETLLNVWLWCLALRVDIVHGLVIFPLMFLAVIGKRPFNRQTGLAFWMLILSLQTAFLGCPLTLLAGWLRSFADPTNDPTRYSVVSWLYRQSTFVISIHWFLAVFFFALFVVCCLRIRRTLHQQEASEL